MDDIYDKKDVIDKINKIREKIDEEKEKGNEEASRELLYAQFYAGLKLSVR